MGVPDYSVNVVTLIYPPLLNQGCFFAHDLHRYILLSSDWKCLSPHHILNRTEYKNSNQYEQQKYKIFKHNFPPSQQLLICRKTNSLVAVLMVSKGINDVQDLQFNYSYYYFVIKIGFLLIILCQLNSLLYNAERKDWTSNSNSEPQLWPSLHLCTFENYVICTYVYNIVNFNVFNIKLLLTHLWLHFLRCSGPV